MNYNDMLGQRFDSLVVTEILGLMPTPSGRIRMKIRCRCDCGNVSDVWANNLRTGTSKSCGCEKQTAAILSCTKHGMARTPTYQSWTGMLGRCQNPNNHKYPRYGGRGIRVCERWKSFENFLADMGVRPEGPYSIERVDNDGNYEPGNCRWATPKEQARNKSTNVCIPIHGRSYILSDAARLAGCTISFFKAALKCGFSPEAIVAGEIKAKENLSPELVESVIAEWGKSSIKVVAKRLGIHPKTVSVIWRSHESQYGLPRYEATNPTHPSLEKVEQVRALMGVKSQREVSRLTGVSRQTIKNIWSDSNVYQN